MSAPFIVGQNCRFRLASDGKPVTLYVIEFEVKKNVTKIADDICGEPRSQLDVITNYFEISAKSRLRDMSALEALLRRQDNDDAGLVPLPATVGLLVLPPSGKRASFIGKDVTIDDWTWASQGRTERNSLTIPMRARYFDPSPTL